ncbi:class I SAM-dependent methyltransferase [Mycobacterium sp. CBMA271]|uniref:class I SAM-dependent methyltransferase n=1 Tax=unclassified Mycobacteroides TaxID=2618759 RepID=UPI0012DC4DD0|nr:MULTISPECIES: class I SAM-dependent methyltransferase [unclassified Mycobacteroides]MUM15893.1 transferase [Mycobacteroides sp. CBMA 326]MUM24505.1 class I SAM-dependent methyltransferase [Mycobacteroides sp. CBMA 271]
MTAPTQNIFEDLYRESLKDGGPIIPWDSKDAKPRIKELALLGAVRGDVLDIGCGLGDNAIYLAQQGFTVTGLDFAPSAIDQAKGRAAASGVTIDFQVADATTLDGWDDAFDTVIDSGVYHCFDGDGHGRYASALRRATRPGARWHIWCFAEGGVHGIPTPFQNAMRREEIEQVLPANGWTVLQLNPTTMSAPKAEFLNAIRDSYRGDPENLDRLEQDVDDPLLYIPIYTVIAERA